MAGDASGVRALGRYLLHEEFASGGMASVHFGRLTAEAGFSRTVAIKRLHPQFAKDPAFVAMLVDEARLLARVRHPNVAPILDVVATGGELFLVMEYVHGESLALLSAAAHRAGRAPPPAVASAVVAGLLHGLSAAHTATSESGEPLGIVHRDVSPENVLVGVDGVPRVLDFGVALAVGRSQVTREGTLKGKIGYMAPELFEGGRATPVSDVYSAGVVLWETLVGRRLFCAEHEGGVLAQVLRGTVEAPSTVVPLPVSVDDVVARAVARAPEDRYPTAERFAAALEAALPPATPREVGAWVAEVAAPSLARRAKRLAVVEARGGDEVELEPRDEAPLDAAAAPAVTELLATSVEAARAMPPRTEVIQGRLADPVSLEGRLADPVSLEGRLADPVSLDAGAPTRVSADAPPPSASRSRAAVALGLVAGFAVLALSFALARRSAHRPSDAAAEGADAASSASGEPAAVATGAPAPPAPSATAGAATERESEASARDPVETAAPERSAAKTPSSAPRASAAPRRAHRDDPCNPPYTVDERGIHRYKPGCL